MPVIVDGTSNPGVTGISDLSFFGFGVDDIGDIDVASDVSFDFSFDNIDEKKPSDFVSGSFECSAGSVWNWLVDVGFGVYGFSVPVSAPSDGFSGVTQPPDDGSRTWITSAPDSQNEERTTPL